MIVSPIAPQFHKYQVQYKMMSPTIAGTTPQVSSAEDARRAARAERHACLQWSAFILLLLGGSVGMWIYAAVIAVSDPTMAVVPDYHEKALQWDKHLEIARASKAVGWTIAVVPGAAQANAQRELTFFLRDRDARPVTGAHGRVRMYHHARGKEVQTIDLVEKEPGSYSLQAAMPRAGTWQLEVMLDRENEHVEQSIEFELTN